jgi:hypothetical protein
MASDNWPENVAVLSEQGGWATDLGLAIADGFRGHGCKVDLVARDSPLGQEYDLVLGYGPHTWEGSLLPFAEQLAGYGKDNRPFFYWWFTEAICKPQMPTWLVRSAAKLHGRASLCTVRSPTAKQRLWGKALERFFIRRHFRLRALGEVYEFHSRGLLDGLAVTATSRADYFRRHGFRPIVAPVGYHPIMHGGDLGLARDIDVGFLGMLHTKRRRQLLERIQKDLERRGIKMVVQTGGLHGEERTRFLNRTKIILNILQVPYDTMAFRLMFCAANKALLVSEPVIDQEPFVPGCHFVTSPVEKMVETMEFYLSHEDQRRQIAEQAHCLICGEYSMHSMVGRILDHARGLHSE